MAKKRKGAAFFVTSHPVGLFLVGIIEGIYDLLSSRPSIAEWGVVKSPQCFEAFCIKHPACSTIRTHAIRTLFRRKRAAKIFVPAAE
jgi:hypothetical protein